MGDNHTELEIAFTFKSANRVRIVQAIHPTTGSPFPVLNLVQFIDDCTTQHTGPPGILCNSISTASFEYECRLVPEVFSTELPVRLTCPFVAPVPQVHEITLHFESISNAPEPVQPALNIIQTLVTPGVSITISQAREITLLASHVPDDNLELFFSHEQTEVPVTPYIVDTNIRLFPSLDRTSISSHNPLPTFDTIYSGGVFETVGSFKNIHPRQAFIFTLVVGIRIPDLFQKPGIRTTELLPHRWGVRGDSENEGISWSNVAFFDWDHVDPGMTITVDDAYGRAIYPHFNNPLQWFRITLQATHTSSTTRAYPIILPKDKLQVVYPCSAGILSFTCGTISMKHSGDELVEISPSIMYTGQTRVFGPSYEFCAYTLAEFPSLPRQSFTPGEESNTVSGSAAGPFGYTEVTLGCDVSIDFDKYEHHQNSEANTILPLLEIATPYLRIHRISREDEQYSDPHDNFITLRIPATQVIFESLYAFMNHYNGVRQLIILLTLPRPDGGPNPDDTPLLSIKILDSAASSESPQIKHWLASCSWQRQFTKTGGIPAFGVTENIISFRTRDTITGTYVIPIRPPTSSHWVIICPVLQSIENGDDSHGGSEHDNWESEFPVHIEMTLSSTNPSIDYDTFIPQPYIVDDSISTQRRMKWNGPAGGSGVVLQNTSPWIEIRHSHTLAPGAFILPGDHFVIQGSLAKYSRSIQCQIESSGEHLDLPVTQCSYSILHHPNSFYHPNLDHSIRCTILPFSVGEHQYPPKFEDLTSSTAIPPYLPPYTALSNDGITIKCTFHMQTPLPLIDPTAQDSPTSFKLYSYQRNQLSQKQYVNELLNPYAFTDATTSITSRRAPSFGWLCDVQIDGAPQQQTDQFRRILNASCYKNDIITACRDILQTANNHPDNGADNGTVSCYTTCRITSKCIDGLSGSTQNPVFLDEEQCVSHAGYTKPFPLQVLTVANCLIAPGDNSSNSSHANDAVVVNQHNNVNYSGYEWTPPRVSHLNDVMISSYIDMLAIPPRSLQGDIDMLYKRYAIESSMNRHATYHTMDVFYDDLITITWDVTTILGNQHSKLQIWVLSPSFCPLGFSPLTRKMVNLNLCKGSYALHFATVDAYPSSHQFRFQDIPELKGFSSSISDIVFDLLIEGNDDDDDDDDTPAGHQQQQGRRQHALDFATHKYEAVLHVLPRCAKRPMAEDTIQTPMQTPTLSTTPVMSTSWSWFTSQQDGEHTSPQRQEYEDDCSGKGVCNLSTDRCTCLHGTVGDRCQYGEDDIDYVCEQLECVTEHTEVAGDDDDDDDVQQECKVHVDADDNTTTVICNCADGFTGDQCQHQAVCGVRQCVNGRLVSPTGKPEECKCECNSTNITGTACNQCTLACRNGGVANTRCTACQCPAGYIGTTCTIPVWYHTFTLRNLPQHIVELILGTTASDKEAMAILQQTMVKYLLEDYSRVLSETFIVVDGNDGNPDGNDNDTRIRVRVELSQFQTIIPPANPNSPYVHIQLMLYPADMTEEMLAYALQHGLDFDWSRVTDNLDFFKKFLREQGVTDDIVPEIDDPGCTTRECRDKIIDDDDDDDDDDSSNSSFVVSILPSPVLLMVTSLLFVGLF